MICIIYRMFASVVRLTVVVGCIIGATGEIKTDDSGPSRSDRVRRSDQITDPDRYHRLASGLLGYDIFYGEPYFLYGSTDPGTRRQIFDPAIPLDDETGRYKLHGITLTDVNSCESHLGSHIVTTAKEVREEMLKKVSVNGGAGFEMKADVSANANMPVGKEGAQVGGSISTTLEASASMAFAKSKTMEEISQFLSDGQHAMSIQDISCTTAQLKLNHFDIPQFTGGFKNALKYLNDANNKSQEEKIASAKHFIHEYGTHYMSEVKLGAKMTYTKFFTKKARQLFNSDQLEKCSKSTSGFKFLFVGANYSPSECKSNYKPELEKASDLVEKVILKTRGSRLPQSIQSWAQQEFTPVPLEIKLLPITGLMEDMMLNQQKDLDIDGEAMRSWFKGMLTLYCSVLGVDCLIRQGCGFDDSCSFNQFCIQDGDVSTCKDIPVKFTARVEPKGEQFLVSCTVPVDRISGATIDIKYRVESGNWQYAVRGYTSMQYQTTFPKTIYYCCRFEFLIQAFDGEKNLIAEVTDRADRKNWVTTTPTPPTTPTTTPKPTTPTTPPPPPPKTTVDCAERGRDWPWFDLSTRAGVATELDCQRACQAEKKCILWFCGCKYWVYSPGSKMCWLKKQKSFIGVSNHDRVSGPVYC